MNVHEMEGFLRGKCLPGDLKVNESNAEYLVRKLNAVSELKGELTAALATIEKCRAITGCPEGVDLQDHLRQLPAPVVTFYRDGIEAAAKWIDQQRELYDSEHGWSDPDTGAFEFASDVQHGYSSTLEELAEGIRALHPNAGNSPAIPDGYVIVPKEPTKEMIDAGWLHFMGTKNP